MINTEDRVFVCRFFEAIKDSDMKMVDKMLSKEDFKVYLDRSEKGTLAFLQVVLLNSIPLLEIFLKHDIDVKVSDCMFFENGVMHAARYGHKEMLQRLIECGVDINHQCKNGSTALHIAVENVKRECLEILTAQKGVDLNIQDHAGFSPLLWTARLRDWRAMKILIRAGCNVESKNFIKGSNALHTVVDSTQAFWKGAKATAEDTQKCIDLLLSVGLDIDSCDTFGNSPLLYALRSNNVAAVVHLLKRNCSFSPDNHSASLVMPFYFHKHLTGSDPDLLPLYVAMSKLQVRCVKMLCLASVQYHKLAREMDIIAYMSDCYPPMGELLNNLVFTPLSLKQASRNIVRGSVMRNVRFIADVNLNLPISLVRYLMLEDLDEI